MQKTFEVASTTTDKPGSLYFDGPQPPMPDEVCGVPTEAALKLGKGILGLSPLVPAKIANATLHLPDALRLMPMYDCVAHEHSRALEPEDVRPYRSSIKALDMRLSAVGAATIAASAIGIGIPARKAFNRKVEEETPRVASEAAKKTREAIAAADVERIVQKLELYDNPRAQLEEEVRFIADEVSRAAMRNVETRLPGASSVEYGKAKEPVKGIKGLLVKIYDGIKSFFGIFSRKRSSRNEHQQQNEISAYDYGAGAKEVFDNLLTMSDSVLEKVPMLSELVLKKLPKELSLKADQLAFMAPEIITFLNSFADDVESSVQKNNWLNIVKVNPHKYRALTKYKRTFNGYSLDGIQRAARLILPAIKDILPTQGHQVRDMYDQFIGLLDRMEASYVPEEPSPEAEEKSIKKRNFFRRVFRKKFKKAN